MKFKACPEPRRVQSSKLALSSEGFEECVCLDSTRSLFRTSNFELRTFLPLAALMVFAAATIARAGDEAPKPPIFHA